jgi:lysophospholipase L1-like esterase
MNPMTDYNKPAGFKEYLDLVEKEARNLQEALLSRDSGRILEAATRQRQALDVIQQYISINDPLQRITPQEKKTVIQPMMNRIRRMLTRNEKMSRVLLGVISKTLSNLSIGTKNTANVYNGYGRVANMASPILVNAQG